MAGWVREHTGAAPVTASGGLFCWGELVSVRWEERWAADVYSDGPRPADVVVRAQPCSGACDRRDDA